MSEKLTKSKIIQRWTLKETEANAKQYKPLASQETAQIQNSLL